MIAARQPLRRIHDRIWPKPDTTARRLSGLTQPDDLAEWFGETPRRFYRL
jgi:hypothetical protein